MGYREEFLQSSDSAVGLARLRRHRNGTHYRVFLDRIHGDGLFRQSQCGGLVTETHIGQSEIANEGIIVRLFFEERFQFVARLSPTFFD